MSEARLYSRGACAVYIGPAFGLTPHRNAAVVIAAGLDTPFQIALEGEIAGGCYIERTVALIAPNTLHHLLAPHGTMAFIYVDAMSREYSRLRCEANGAFGSHLPAAREQQVIGLLRQLRSEGPHAWPGVREQLRIVLGLEARDSRDSRIDRALEIIHSQPSSRPSLDDLSRSVGLSASRFIHLFKAHTGVPFRRYKAWAALGTAVRAISRGADLTTASADAGFATPSHFSATFRAMFGMEPSRLARAMLRHGDTDAVCCPKVPANT
jgi:AraC-like DNA-binding protein